MFIIPPGMIGIPFKAGDQDRPDQHFYAKLFSGMATGEYFDPDNLPPELLNRFGGYPISDWMQVVYFIGLYPKEMLGTLKPLLRSVGGVYGHGYFSGNPGIDFDTNEKNIFIEADDTYRASGLYVNFEEIGNALGITNLKERILGEDIKVDALDLSVLPVEYLKESKFIDFKKSLDFAPVEDKNVITAGSYTIGAGQTYATLNAFKADIGTQTGDLTGTVKTSITETLDSSFTHASGGFRLTLTSDGGRPYDNTKGWALTFTAGGAGSCVIDTRTGSGTFKIEFLRFIVGATYNTNTAVLRSAKSTTAGGFLVKDCYIDFNGNTALQIGTQKSTANADPYHIYNVIVDRLRYYGIHCGNFAGTKVVENCFVDGSGGSSSANSNGYYNPTASTVTMRNNIGVHGTNIRAFGNVAAAIVGTGRNNASTDATADDFTEAQSGGIINFIASTELQATAPGAGYGHQKYDGSSQFKGGGNAVTISGHDHDIFGKVGKRGGSTPSIGVNELGGAFPIAALQGAGIGL